MRTGGRANGRSRAHGPAPVCVSGRVQSFFLEADFAFLSARFSFKDFPAAVFALDFFGDLSAMATTPLVELGRLRTCDDTPSALRMGTSESEPVDSAQVAPPGAPGAALE
jgi:hypothetical protein